MVGKENLRELLPEAAHRIGQEIERLAVAAADEDPSLPETIATYESVGVLGHARAQMGRALLESRVIFEGKKQLEETVVPPVLAADGEVCDGERDESPRTFGELLRTKIEEALPEGQAQFNATDLARVLGNEHGVRIALNTLGLPRRGSFNRATAIDLAYKVLTTTRSNSTSREAYYHNDLYTAFHTNLKASALNEWSQLIGHDWKATPTVDISTALAIRGLTMLSKLTASQQRQSA